MRIGTAKLNLDLYDRRFKVFEATRALLGRFLIEGTFTPEEITKFSAATSEAVFLFEADVPNYLNALREKAFAHRKMNRQTKTAPDDKIEQIADEMAEIEDQMSEEIPRLISVFKPYLKLGNI